MKRILLSLSLVFCCVANSFGQFDIQIDSTTGLLGLGDTVLLGSSHTVIVYYENMGNAPLDVGVTFFMQVTPDATGTPGSVHQVATKSYDTTSSLPPGFVDTVMFTLEVTPSYYMLGGNTTVIWPVASGLDGDTLSTELEVLLNQSIQGTGDGSKYPAMKVYPNPVKSHLNIDYIGKEGDIEQVRIISLDGRVVFTGKLQPQIDVSAFKAGLYLIEVRFKNGVLRRNRFQVID